MTFANSVLAQGCLEDSESVHERPADRVRAMVETHSRVVWRFLRRLGLVEADADDATQEVLMVAVRRLEAIRPGSERAFLLSTAYRVAISMRRVRQRRQEIGDEALLEIADRKSEPDVRAEQRRMLRLLDQVLCSMPLDRRAVFVAAEFEGLSLTEVARVMGIPRGTAASRLRLARGEFQAAVARLEARLTRGRTEA